MESVHSVKSIHEILKVFLCTGFLKNTSQPVSCRFCGRWRHDYNVSLFVLPAHPCNFTAYIASIFAAKYLDILHRQIKASVVELVTDATFALVCMTLALTKSSLNELAGLCPLCVLESRISTARI